MCASFFSFTNHFISFSTISYILCQPFYFSATLCFSAIFSLLVISYILCQLCSISLKLCDPDHLSHFLYMVVCYLITKYFLLHIVENVDPQV
jgi:hypothetical protein